MGVEQLEQAQGDVVGARKDGRGVGLEEALGRLVGVVYVVGGVELKLRVRLNAALAKGPLVARHALQARV